MYWELLNSQVMVSSKMRNSGNMTHQEKKINKSDLQAFKSYDPESYGMVPGINNQNKVHKSPWKETAIKSSRDPERFE